MQHMVNVHVCAAKDAKVAIENMTKTHEAIAHTSSMAPTMLKIACLPFMQVSGAEVPTTAHGYMQQLLSYSAVSNRASISNAPGSGAMEIDDDYEIEDDSEKTENAPKRPEKAPVMPTVEKSLSQALLYALQEKTEFPLKKITKIVNQKLTELSSCQVAAQTKNVMEPKFAAIFETNTSLDGQDYDNWVMASRRVKMVYKSGGDPALLNMSIASLNKLEEATAQHDDLLEEIESLDEESDRLLSRHSKHKKKRVVDTPSREQDTSVERMDQITEETHQKRTDLKTLQVTVLQRSLESLFM